MEAIDAATGEAPTLPDGPRGLLIGGEFVDAAAGTTMVDREPATGAPQAEVATAGGEDVERAVKAARTALEGAWGATTPAERGKVLWRAADLIEQNAAVLALIETLDNGKPLAESEGDIWFAAETIRYFAGAATKIGGRTITPSNPGRWHAYTRREPYGVVGQIVPWNFPLMLACWKLAPALATGNTVVLKPAEQTPLSALRLGEIFLEAGLPPGAFNVLNGEGPVTGAAIAAHPGIDKVSFTGSAETGRAIVRAAMGNLKKVSLELGGKSPNIVFADADLEAATTGAAQAIFRNMGEVCIAGSRLYVQEDVFDEVVDEVAQRAGDLKIGPGTDPESEIGPLVDADHLRRVTGYIDAGLSSGARALVGGGRHGSEGYFVEPTVLVDVESEASVVREEIFGPVLVARSFSDPAELSREANDTRYGLAAGVWTKDLSKAHEAAAALQAGMVFVNNWGAVDPALPFGGYKESGWGRELGPDAVEEYLQTKTVVVAL